MMQMTLGENVWRVVSVLLEQVALGSFFGLMVMVVSTSRADCITASKGMGSETAR
jgi:hypothetical protein